MLSFLSCGWLTVCKRRQTGASWENVGPAIYVDVTSHHLPKHCCRLRVLMETALALLEDYVDYHQSKIIRDDLRSTTVSLSVDLASRSLRS